MAVSVAVHAAVTAGIWLAANEMTRGGSPVFAFELTLDANSDDVRAAAAFHSPSAEVNNPPIEASNESSTERESDLPGRDVSIETAQPASAHSSLPFPTRKPTPVVSPRPVDVALKKHDSEFAAKLASVESAQSGARLADASEASRSPSEDTATSRPTSINEPTVVHDPKFLRRPSPPSYPERAVELSQQGVTFVRALVIDPGKPKQTVVWQSSGYPLLDSAALAAVSRWEFEPLRLAGETQPAWIQVPVKFRLN